MTTGKRFLTILVALAALSVPAAVHADGKAYKITAASTLIPVREKEQRAAIVHSDGTQRMVIAVNLEVTAEEKAVWIFPVPGTPDRTDLDVVAKFPDFDGRDPLHAARNRVETVMSIARALHIYPAVFEASLGTQAEDTMMNVANIIGAAGVTVHEEVEKWGIHAESITAESTAALGVYLQGKKATIPEAELKAFDDYLSEDYILVLVWIASQKEVLEKFPDYQSERVMWSSRWPCVYVEFPTDRPFYPLKPTSTYGAVHIPLNLYVVGHWKLESDPRLDMALRVKHYEHRSGVSSGPRRFSRALPGDDFTYTHVRSRDVPASRFVEDLWFSPLLWSRCRYAQTINAATSRRFGYILGLVLVASLSYVSAGLSALFLYGKWRRYAFLGIFNFFSILGFRIALAFAKDDDGHPLKKQGRFTVAFTIVYVGLTVPLQLLLLWPLGGT